VIDPTRPVRPPPSSAPVGRSGGGLLSQVKDLWARGEPADARAVLAQYPELGAEKSAVLDLAYEEYCLHLEAGQGPDPDEFCKRFPAFRTSLRRLLAAHHCLEENATSGGGEPLARWPEPGDTFLGFALTYELGRGAFARVFLAAEPALGDRLVAVKISPHGAAEALTQGPLKHPNVVPIYSVQQEELTGLSVVCMPYLGSATLCDVLDRAFARPGLPVDARLILEAARDTVLPDGVPAEQAPPHPLLRRGTYVEGILHLAAQLAEALHFLHAQGICHRDLKPSNILMTPAGKPMLLDFNLAFDARRGGQRLGGTLPYMAPEQLLATDPAGGAARPVDARSDLFAFGVILYELLTGSHPFGQIPLGLPSPQVRKQLLEWHKQGPWPLRHANPRVERAVARCIEQCLAYEPADRPRSAAELAAVFRRPLAWHRRARRYVALHPWRVLGATVVVLLVGLATAAGWSAYQRYEDGRQFEPGLKAYRQADYGRAVQAFSRFLRTNPDHAEALYLRGRAQQKAGDLSAALADYERADRLRTDGRVKACVGYCLSERRQHSGAIFYYHEAIEAGFAPAEVYNNLGVSHLLSQDRLDEAKKNLDIAIALNPSLQAAFHNRALFDLDRVGKDPEHVPEAGLADIRRALQLGLATAELYYHAACLCALVAEANDQELDPALDYLEKAIALGRNPQALEEDGAFASLHKNPRFQALVRSPPAPQPMPSVSRLLDPINDASD
jgi:tetratricopeptide (TPR) repeat protein